MQKLINFWYTTMEGRYMSRMGHFTTGFMISTIAGHFSSLLWGLLVSMFAGFSKEVMDYKSGKGEVSFVAFILTCLGGLLAYLILSI